LIPVDKTSFDFTWRPDPREPAFIYVWGNQFNNSVIEPTIEYHCDGATERKYMNDKVAKTLPMVENWKILVPVDDFDFSWRPDPSSKAAIYEWGLDGPVYTVPDATETINIEYDTSLREVEEQLIEEPVEIIQKEVIMKLIIILILKLIKKIIKEILLCIFVVKIINLI
jgi:hypothetical protein